MTKLDKDQLEKISGGVKNESLDGAASEDTVVPASMVNQEIADLANGGEDGPSLERNTTIERS